MAHWPARALSRALHRGRFVFLHLARVVVSLGVGSGQRSLLVAHRLREYLGGALATVLSVARCMRSRLKRGLLRIGEAIVRASRVLLRNSWHHRGLVVAIPLLATSILSWTTSVLYNNQLVLGLFARDYSPALRAFTSISGGVSNPFAAEGNDLGASGQTLPLAVPVQTGTQSSPAVMSRQTSPGRGYARYVPFDSPEGVFQGEGSAQSLPLSTTATMSRQTQPGQGYTRYVPPSGEEGALWIAKSLQPQTEEQKTSPAEPVEKVTGVESSEGAGLPREAAQPCPCDVAGQGVLRRGDKGFNELLRLAARHADLGRLLPGAASSSVMVRVTPTETQISQTGGVSSLASRWISVASQPQSEQSPSDSRAILSVTYVSPVGALEPFDGESQGSRWVRQVESICWSASSPGLATSAEGAAILATSLSLCVSDGQVVVAQFPAPIDKEIEEFLLRRPIALAKGSISTVLLCASLFSFWTTVRRHVGSRWGRRQPR